MGECYVPRVDETRFPDLRAFISRLRRDNDLIEIDAPVDSRLEVAEIHRRVIAAGGPALLFRRVVESDFPLVTNLFGTPSRAQMAFGRDPAKLVRRAVEFVQRSFPPSLGSLWSARDLLAAGLRLGMRSVGKGPVRDVESTDVKLDRLPVITSWPEDGGPFLTLPLVYTEDPDGPGHNLGIYRMQVHDKRTTGMHWQIGKGGGFHFARAVAKGEALPVTTFPSSSWLRCWPDVASDGAQGPVRTRCWPMQSSHSPGSYRPTRPDPRGRLATTTATIHSATTTRSFASSASLIGAMRSSRRRLSENHARRISSSATCCKSSCHRSFRS
jgi:hypothetical protein